MFVVTFIFLKFKSPIQKKKQEGGRESERERMEKKIRGELFYRISINE